MRKVNPVMSGERCVIPQMALGIQRGEKWINAPAPSDGVVLCFDAHESADGGIFISAKNMRLWLKEITEKRKNTKEND